MRGASPGAQILHDWEVGALLEQIREESYGYTVPEWGCSSYRTLFADLATLETDTLRHVHIENHVLAPRARDRALARPRGAPATERH